MNGSLTMKRAIKFVVISLLAGLSACTNGVRSDVSTFHKLTAPAGESYVLVALDPKKQDGLELGHYMPMVKAELDKLGYTEARAGSTPDITVRMDFEISPARDEVRPRMGGYGSPFGYGSGLSLGFGFGGRRGLMGFNSYLGYNPFGPRYYGFYDPFYRPFGFYGMGYGWGHYGGMWNMYRPFVVKVYDHNLEMNITRGAKTIVFEGKASTKRRRKNMTTQMPILVAAMFKEFPGESGKHRRVLVKLPKNK